MEKSKVLIIGGTGYLGKRLVKASLAEGHETYILHRTEIGVDIDKVQITMKNEKWTKALVYFHNIDIRSWLIFTTITIVMLKPIHFSCFFI